MAYQFLVLVAFLKLAKKKRITVEWIALGIGLSV